MAVAKRQPPETKRAVGRPRIHRPSDDDIADAVAVNEAEASGSTAEGTPSMFAAEDFPVPEPSAAVPDTPPSVADGRSQRCINKLAEQLQGWTATAAAIEACIATEFSDTDEGQWKKELAKAMSKAKEAHSRMKKEVRPQGAPARTNILFGQGTGI